MAFIADTKKCHHHTAHSYELLLRMTSCTSPPLTRVGPPPTHSYHGSMHTQNESRALNSGCYSLAFRLRPTDNSILHTLKLDQITCAGGGCIFNLTVRAQHLPVHHNFVFRSCSWLWRNCMRKVERSKHVNMFLQRNKCLYIRKAPNWRCANTCPHMLTSHV